MSFEELCDKTIEYGFYCLFFLVPLIVTPFNYELFEYNKMMLVYFLTVIIVASWISKMILQRRVLIRRTPFDIPLLLFLASQVASTIFSIDRHTSLWGYYSRFHGGLLSTFSYILLFYAFSSNFDKKKVLNSLYWLLSIGAVVCLYGILEHFGHSVSCLVFEGKFGVTCWVQDVQNRVFATLGQPNWLAAWLVALMPIPVALLLSGKFRIKRRKSAALLILLALFYCVLLYTKSRSALAGLGVTWIVFWVACFFLYRKNLKTLLRPFMAANLTIALVTLLAGSPFTPSLGNIVKKATRKAQAAETVVAPAATPTPIIHEVVRGGTESYEIRKIVWKGAIDIWRAWPLFGSGVETFAYSYYNFRPAEHNLVSEWDFLYNKAHNEYLNFAATTGSFGLGSILLLTFWFVVWNGRELKEKSKKLAVAIKGKLTKEKRLSIKRELTQSALVFALFAGWLSIPVTNFFGFSVVAVALLFFLFPAASVVLTKETSLSRNVNISPFPEWPGEGKMTNSQYGAIAAVLCFTFFLIFLLCRFWYADTLFAKAKKAEKQGNYSQAYELAQKAAALNKNEPLYHDTLSYAAAGLAEQAFIQKQTSLARELATLAVAESDKVLATSPRNLNFLKTRAKDFYKLASLDRKYLVEAEVTLREAGKLAPTDAKIFYNLGLVYIQLGESGEAIEILEKTVKMKKNYQDARYALSLLYEQGGQKQKALEHAEYILTYINSSVAEVRQIYKRLTGREFVMPE